MKNGAFFFFVFFYQAIFAGEFKTGDLVFRQENTLLSKLFSNIESSEYAHIGIVWQKSNQAYVVHSEIADGEDGLRVQKWDEFVKNSAKWMVMRPKQIQNSDKLEEVISKSVRLKPKFNISFEHNTKNKLYCTQLVQVIYKEALGVNIAPSMSNYQGRSFISTKDIYSNPVLTQIAKKSKKEE